MPDTENTTPPAASPPAKKPAAKKPAAKKPPAKKPPAKKPAAKSAPELRVMVRSRGTTFRRGGQSFSAEPREVSRQDIGAKNWDAIMDEAQLIKTPLDA